MIDKKLDGYLGLTYEFMEAEKAGNSYTIKAILEYVTGKSKSIQLKYDRQCTVHGQVSQLIEMAQDDNQLSRMWIGWSAYM